MYDWEKVFNYLNEALELDSSSNDEFLAYALGGGGCDSDCGCENR